MSRMIRKRIRHCGRYGYRAGFIQVSYFPYTTPRAAGRQRKFQVSTPRQRVLNNRNAQKSLEALVNTNFGKGDLLLGLSYSDENMPGDMKEAKQKFHNFIRRLNRRREKQGLSNARYIVVTEISGTGRVHHHVIMDSDLDRDTVEEIWGQGYANTKRLKPDPKKRLVGVVSYIAKTFKEDESRPQRMRRWDCSQNLKKPWDSINDNPRMMSHKKMRLMKDLPEDSECMKKIIELDNPHYELISVEKEYSEESGQWHFFCRMQLSTQKDATVYKVDNNSIQPDKGANSKCKKTSPRHGSRAAKPPPKNTGPP